MLRLAHATATAAATRSLKARAGAPLATAAAARWSARSLALPQPPTAAWLPQARISRRTFSTATPNQSDAATKGVQTSSLQQQQPGSSTPPPPPPPSSASPKPPRSWLRLGLLAGLGVVVVSSAGLLLISQQLEPSNPLRTHAGNLSTFSNALLRFWRDLYCTVRIVADYESSLKGVNPDSEEYKTALKEVHLRSALRLRELMRTNGGVYIKFGQHIAQVSSTLHFFCVHAQFWTLRKRHASGF